MAESIITSQRPLFLTYEFSRSYKPSSSYTDISIPCPEITGYTPIGIAGFKIPRPTSMEYRTVLQSDGNGGKYAHITLHNFSTSSTAATFMIKMLYMRDDPTPSE